jgi:hypothetical protein
MVNITPLRSPISPQRLDMVLRCERDGMQGRRAFGLVEREEVSTRILWHF